MKLRILVLVIAGVLFLSPLAMAGELGSSDSNFLFGKDQVAATTITDQEMQATQGQQINLDALLTTVLGLVLGILSGDLFE